MRFLRWADAHLYTIPGVVALLTIAVLVALRFTAGEWVALSGQPAGQRGQFYSALTGVSSGLLGFTLAALSILAAFGRAAQRRLRAGTAGLVQILLSTSLALLVVLTVSLVSLILDNKHVPNAVCAMATLAGCAASLIGLLLSLGAFTLAVIANQQE